jgi:tetratricopeptide (TPR) repeat protein
VSASVPSSYPGNPALPREVREKILSTFRHTLNLYQTGKLDDCLIGCDFILKMDPRFSPARQLLDKAKNPQAAVDVRQLEALVSETPTRQERVVAAQPDRLLVRAVESFNARDFDAAIAAADEVLAALPGNRDALEIRDNALRKKQAQPQFESLRQRALAALEADRKDQARRELDRMRQLDADHPAVALLERRIGPAPKPAAGGADLSRQGGGTPGAPFEPELAFDGDSTNPAGHAAAPEEPAGGLDALSLDSLSLEEPPEPPRPAPPPPPDRGRVPAAPPGSPGDLWSGGTEEPELDLGVSPDLPGEDSEPASTQLEIELLLRQGDEAAERGDRQQAIEIWSRIFLIDINNTEAVLRIEKARQDMAEGNRRISEGLRQGKEQYEARDLAAARMTFLEVLANDENEPTARSYLDRIEQELAQPAAPEDLAQTVRADVLAEEMAEPLPLPPPPLVEREKAVRAPRAGIRPRLLLLVAVFAVLVAGGVFLVLNLPDKSGTPAQEANAPSLERATLLFREGKLTETVAELRRIPVEHPDYARAQKLLASLTRPLPAAPEGAPAGEAAPPPGGGSDSAPVTAANEPALIRAEAEKALAEKRYITALKGFNQAAPAFQEDPSFAKQMGTAAEKVTELTPAVKLYNEGEYESAIPILWRLYQADRQNRDARDYLLRSYHNQGVGHLQNGLYSKAREAFDEILAVDPGDPQAARHRKFAERYAKGDLDLLGRIYVRHLQQRP